MRTTLLPRVFPVLIGLGIPLAVASCSSNNDNSGSGGTGGGTSAAGGTGGASGSTSASAGKGGSGANGGTGGSTGGSATGGSSGTGGSGAVAGSTSKGGTGGSTGATGNKGGRGGSTGATGNKGGAGAGGKGMAGSGAGGAATGGAGGAHGGASSTGGATTTGGATGMGGATGTGGAATGSFVIASNDLMEGAKFGTMFTCNGGNVGSAGINPELHWSGSPAGAMSFAITFIDTTLGADNSLGQHWAMYNIPPTVMEIAQGALTKTLMGDISMAKQATPLNNGFLAPCAQSLTNGMDDNYEFTIYALSTASLSNPGTSVKSVLQALGVLNSGGMLVSPPMLNSAVIGTAVLHGHSGLKGQ